MGLFSDKPYTAITAQIEQICGRKSSDEDAADLLELIEAIKIARDPGYAEAGRALRKQLKHGGPKQQLRGLWLLEMLIDNGGRKMPQLLEDPGLGDQLQLIARATGQPPKLARNILSAWAIRDDDRLRRWSPSGHARTSASDGQAEYRRHSRNPSRQSGQGHAPGTASRPQSRSPSPINILGGSITSTIATAHTIATRLSEQVITHPNVQQSTEGRGYYKQAKDMRKRVINLIHKDDPEVQEFLDRLLVVNEELVTSIQAFENAKPGQADGSQGASRGESRDALHERPHERHERPYDARPAPAYSEPPSYPARPARQVSPPPSPLRSPRTPRTEPPNDDPFADINESTDAPLVRPMW